MKCEREKGYILFQREIPGDQAGLELHFELNLNLQKAPRADSNFTD